MLKLFFNILRGLQIWPWLKHSFTILLAIIISSMLFSYKNRVPVHFNGPFVLEPNVQAGSRLHVWLNNVHRRQICQELSYRYLYRFVRNPQLSNLNEANYHNILAKEPRSAAIPQFVGIKEAAGPVSLLSSNFVVDFQIPSNIEKGTWFFQVLAITRCGMWSWLIGPAVIVTVPVKIIISNEVSNEEKSLVVPLTNEEINQGHLLENMDQRNAVSTIK